MSNPKWSTEEKIQARQTTIDIIRRLWLNKISPSKHYITMCGKHTENNQIYAGSELDHLIKEKFLVPKQFIGVDTDPNIVNQARLACPQAHWKRGRIQKIIHELSEVPEIINLDTMNMSGNAWTIIKPVMDYIEDHAILVYLIVNIVAKRRYDANAEEERIISFIEKKVVHNGGWKFHGQFTYQGRRKSTGVEMCTYFLQFDPIKIFEISVDKIKSEWYNLYPYVQSQLSGKVFQKLDKALEFEIEQTGLLSNKPSSLIIESLRGLEVIEWRDLISSNCG